MNRRIEPGMGDFASVDVATVRTTPEGGSSTVRRPWLAGLLGFLLPVVAFAYVGRLGLGLLLGLAVPGVFALFGQSGLIQSAAGFWAFGAVLVIWLIFQICCPWWIARRHRRTYRLRWYNRWYIYLPLAMLFPLSYQWALENRAELFGYATYRIPSSSMASTLMPGDMVIVDTRPRSLRNIKRNDLVVHRRGDGTDTAYVRRVIGLPGEMIAIDADGVTVAGVKLDEPFAQGRNDPQGAKVLRVTLSPDEYFLMGDNRGNSLDSRYAGPFPAAEIFGKASAIFYSPDPGRIGPLR